MKKNVYFLEELAEKVLLEAKNYYEIKKNFSDEILLNLHSIYGTTLQNALDILDRGKIIKYQPKKSVRCIFMIQKRKEQFLLYEGINFCFCDVFREEVLNELRRSITCEHVLALQLGKIANKITSDNNIKEPMLIETLNNAGLSHKDE
nr:uncharacterized protein LOC111413114 [Onthophagus taurus]